MVSRLYALLVGIDAYRDPITPLSGCRNDIELAGRLLRGRAPDVALTTLLDEQATRANIVAGFQHHLARAGAGDIALFWFSGHGSTGRLPADLWYAESAGECQTVVCYDSRRGGVGDLYDKELAILVRDVTAGGARLVTIMDSCHSRGVMRSATGLPPRFAPSLATPPTLRALLPGLVADAQDPNRPMPGAKVPGHIALSACQEHELANEDRVDGIPHGVFSHALNRTLARLGPRATYREVLSGARCLVEGRFHRQLPALEVADPHDADLDFLGSTLRPRAAQVTMRHLRGDWEVDVGAVHGVTRGPVAGDTRFARHHSEPVEEVRVVEVAAERSVVEPIGWTPDPERQYDMVLTRVPLPRVAVVVEGSADIGARMSAVVDVVGPGGGPSPHIRVVPEAEVAAAALVLRARVTHESTIVATSADDEPLAAPEPADDRGIARTVSHLEHVARWLQVRNLENPGSRLRDAVRVEIVRAAPGEHTVPFDREAEPPGAVAFEYTRTGDGWAPPSVFLRLRNTTDARLFCVLADLTDRYRLHVGLFPGEHIAAGVTTAAGYGRPITLSLPPDRPVVPGAAVKDWLMLMVAEAPFSSDPFSLPRLGEVARGGTRGISGIRGVLDRLGLVAVRRDIDPTPDAAVDWATSIVEITTSVPG